MSDEIILPSWVAKILISLLFTLLTGVFFAGEMYFTIESMVRRLDLITIRMEKIEQRLNSLEH